MKPQLSSDASILRRAKRAGYSYRPHFEGRILLPTRLNRKGYVEVMFPRIGWVLLHRAIAYFCFGNRVLCRGAQVRHRDHNKENCHPSNLCIGTLAQNGADNRTNLNVKKW